MGILEEVKDEIEDLEEELQEERDHLKVQLHLLNMDAKDKWDELETKYDQFKSKAGEVNKAVEETSEGKSCA